MKPTALNPKTMVAMAVVIVLLFFGLSRALGGRNPAPASGSEGAAKVLRDAR